KSNNIFGTIFGIFDRKRLPAAGSDLFAAGYLIYGPATTLVYATARGVHEFVQGGGGRPEEFFLIEEGIRLPAKGKLYGVGGHRDRWIPEVKAFVGELERELMNLRYGGSFVGDFNQILHYGGFFVRAPEVANNPFGAGEEIPWKNRSTKGRVSNGPPKDPRSSDSASRNGPQLPGSLIEKHFRNSQPPGRRTRWTVCT